MNLKKKNIFSVKRISTTGKTTAKAKNVTNIMKITTKKNTTKNLIIKKSLPIYHPLIQKNLLLLHYQILIKNLYISRSYTDAVWIYNDFLKKCLYPPKYKDDNITYEDCGNDTGFQWFIEENLGKKGEYFIFKRNLQMCMVVDDIEK